MCRIPRIVIVAPSDRQQDIRRAVSSLEYEVVAAVPDVASAGEISADVALVWEPTELDVATLRALGRKTVAVGPDAAGADMHLTPEDVASLKTRIWELFRPA